MDDFEAMMEPLLNEAREKGLWIVHHYSGEIFRPDELRQIQKDGVLRHGPINWGIMDPRDKIEHLKDNVRRAEEELHDFQRRVEEGK